MTDQESWEAYFDPGERLIWQGAPVPGVHVGPGGIFLSLFGLPFLLAGLGVFFGGIYALFRGDAGFMDGAGGLFAMVFALPFICVGGLLTSWPWVRGPLEARRVRYALTDRRAYVAKRFFKRSMESYPIVPEAPLELERGKTDSVYFHTYHTRDSDGDTTVNRVGFENIAEGEEVYGLLRRIQRGEA